jgi:polyhydroxybutyrate depolymerase
MAAVDTFRAVRRLALLGASACLLFAVLTPSAEAARRSSCSISAAAGEQTVPLSDQGEDRPFLLYVPAGYDGHGRLPLVLNLHGSGGDADGQMAVSGFEPAADAKDLAVVAPNGAIPVNGGYAWNVPGVPLATGDPVPAGTPNDERYLLHVIRKAERSVCIDPKRVYFTGYSGGARMSSQMGCDHADQIAAIAPVAGLRSGVPKQGASGAWRPDGRTCRPAQPISVLAFHGTADNVNPFQGSDDSRWGYSVPRALSRWAKLNRCKAGPTTKPATPSVDSIEYRRCRGKASVQLYRAEGAAHTWPGSTATPADQTDQTMSATNKMISFFARHPLLRAK